MKRIILFILLLTFAMSFSFTVSGADADTESLDRAVSLLTDLNIISSESNYNDSITRGEFTGILISAMGIENISAGEAFPFTDVGEGDSFYDAVQTAYSLGIVSGSEKFDPSREVSVDEMVKMTVCAAGYDFLAQYYGSWHAGYHVAANKLKMMSGVDTGKCTFATAYVLLYNTLTTPLPEIKLIDGNLEYSVHSDENILESIYGFTLVEGFFDGAQYFGGKSGTGVGEGCASISGTIVKSGRFDTDSLYGLECSGYCDENGVLQTVYTTEPNSNAVVVLKSGDDVTYSNLTYTYYDEKDDLRKITVSDRAIIVLNGKAATFDEDIMLPKRGSVKLMRTGSGGYDTVIIESYDEIVVGAINAEKEYISDIRGTKQAVSFDASQYSDMSIFDQNGRTLEFGDIKKYDIVWVAQSEDKQILKVKASKEYFAGEYTGNGNNDTIYIDGEPYLISGSRESVIPSSVNAGSIVTVHFNCDGKIAYITKDNTGAGMKVAYLVGSKASGNLECKITVRLFTLEGKMRDFVMAPRFSVNGIGFNSSFEDYAKLPKDESNPGFMISDLVTYILNSKNQLVAINYSQDVAEKFGGTKADIFKNGYIDKYQGEHIDQYIRFFEKQQEIVSRSGGRIYLNPYTAVQMLVPRSSDFDKAEEKDYKIRNFTDVASGTYLPNYYHYGFSFDDSTMYSSIILSVYGLTSDMGQVDVTDHSYMVSSVSRGFDGEGNEATILELTNKLNASLKLYTADDKFIVENGISKGDVVKVDYLNSELNGITLIYNAGSSNLSNKTNLGSTGCTITEGGSVMTNNEGMASLATSYNVLGKVYRRDGEVIAVLPSSVDINGDINSSMLKTFSVSTLTKIFKYDSKTDRIYEIYADNIEDYLSVGNSCDTVVVESDGGYLESVFVFE